MRAFFGRVLRSVVAVLPAALCAASAAVWADVARTADASGTGFWLAFQENALPGALSLRILGESGTTGTVEIAGLAFSAPFAVDAGGMATIAIPAGAMLTQSDGVEPLGVHVTAGAPVVVYGFDVAAGSASGWLALPTTALGALYDVISYPPDSLDPLQLSQLAVVATAQGTVVELTLTAPVGPHPAGSTYQVMLDAGQVYQAQSAGDLTGTRIQATSPVAVHSGNSAAIVPLGVESADQLAEMLLPTAAWSESVFAVPSAGRSQPERLRVQAALNGTSVTFSTGGGVVLNAGQFYDAALVAPLLVQATHPVLVSRFATGGEPDNWLGDPFLLVEQGSERFSHGYRVATADNGALFQNNFVNIVAPAGAAGRIVLDGERIPAAEFSPIGATGSDSCRRAISPGVHRLSGPVPFGASVYGFGDNVGYGSPAGGESLPFVDGFEEGDDLAWSAVVP